MIGRVIMSLVALLVGVVAIAYLVGRTLPTAHDVSITRDIEAPRDVVARLVRDVEAQPTWRRGVTRISVTSRNGTEVRYVESGTNDDMPFHFREVAPEERFTSVIDTDQLPFSGTWTIRLEAQSAARTRVTIREEGTVGPPIFRVISTYIIGHTRTIETYLEDLATAAVAQPSTTPDPAPVKP